jgi:RNA polymerase sigma-70 factor, ECF subfamily
MSGSFPTSHRPEGNQDVSILVKSAQGGNLDAFTRLVLSYQDQAYNLAYRMLGDSDSAEDATQNAFISAYRNLATYRGGSFRAWVLRILTNTCIDELRHRKRHPVTGLEPETNDGEEIESPLWLADNNPIPEETIERLEMERIIQNCLNELPIEFRSVVVMVDVQGMDYEEVAVVIGKPLGTIKSRLMRARLKLRRSLQNFKEGLNNEFSQHSCAHYRYQARYA